MDTPAIPSFNGSRLVRLLSAFIPADIEAPGRYFADRFGNLVGLAGSMSLSKVHAELSATGLKPDVTATSAGAAKMITEAFLRARRSLVRAIAMSFIPMAGNPKDRLPTPERLHAHFQLTGVFAVKRPGNPQTHATAFEPYRQFYTARQRELEMKVRQLRSHIGAEISGISPQSAQLSTLDASLGEVLLPRTQELFAVIPKLLERRFGGGLDAHRRTLSKAPAASDLAQWIEPDGWIGLFCNDMRALLLAELEVRLQPVSGMIESLSETSAADHLLDQEKGPDCD
ncbi:MAG: DUF3348 family protein [Desulfobacterales bacterium]|jgi:hypothetical protein|nr:DUF3348 family protein [Desulfobacterales bacterium]